MFGREWISGGFVLVATVVLAGCGNGASDSDTPAPGTSDPGVSGPGGTGNSNGSAGASSTSLNGLVVSHSDGGNDCTTFYGREQAKTFIPSELGPCPARTAVVCAKCENEYPNILFAGDGIKSKDEIFSRASNEACVAWAEGSTRADVCEVEAAGKFTAVAPGVGGPSGLARPETVPGTLSESLGPYQFSLFDFRIVSGAVTLPSCTNFYGTGVSDDLRWRGQNIPCPDANRTRTTARPYAIDGVAAENVTAEYVYYN